MALSALIKDTIIRIRQKLLWRHFAVCCFIPVLVVAALVLYGCEPEDSNPGDAWLSGGDSGLLEQGSSSGQQGNQNGQQEQLEEHADWMQDLWVDAANALAGD